MRNLLALIGFATVTFLGLGWYLGWYKIQRSTTPDSNGSTLQIGVDTRKVAHDIQSGVNGVTELVNSLGTPKEKSQTSSSWYEAPPARPAVAPTNPLPQITTPAPVAVAPTTVAPSWYDPTPVPPATAKPSGWRVIQPAKR